MLHTPMLDPDLLVVDQRRLVLAPFAATVDSCPSTMGDRHLGQPLARARPHAANGRQIAIEHIPFAGLISVIVRCAHRGATAGARGVRQFVAR